jgi:hypothetical protein
MKQNNQLDMLLEKMNEDVDSGKKNKIYIVWQSVDFGASNTKR